MQETYTWVPAWLTRTPCGMSQAGIEVSVCMEGVYTTVTGFVAGWIPKKSELATNAKSPSGVRPMVVGYMSAGARPRTESVTASNRQRDPVGTPWAMVT